MTQEQINEILEGQRAIVSGIEKLLGLFTLEPINDATNPILNISQAAKLLGTTTIYLSKACERNEVPHRRLGSKYIFSKVALLGWLHCINMSFLGEKVATLNSYTPNPSCIDNWIRIAINPISGAQEEYQVKYSEPKEEPLKIDTIEAARLVGISENKMRQWAREFLYYRVPVTRIGCKVMFEKDKFIEWTKTPTFKKLMEEHVFYRDRQAEAQKEAKASREARKLEEEAKKKKRIERKMKTNMTISL